MSVQGPLKDYMATPDASEGDVKAGWDAVDGALTFRRRRRQVVRGVGAIAGAAVIAMACWRAWGPQEATVAHDGAHTGEENAPAQETDVDAEWLAEVLETETADSPEQSLAPHVRARLHRGTRLERRAHGDDHLHVALLRGEVEFDVTPGVGTTWIDAGDVQVRVLGTQFRVVRDAEGTRVAVTRGRVAVRRGDAVVAELVAGDDATFEDVDGSESAGTQDGPVEAVQTARAETERAAGSRGRSADDSGESGEADPVVARFTDAQTARRGGQLAEAESHYAWIVAHHPRHSRASLAALELGRLRMDGLNNPRAAAAAFAQAVRLGPRSPFHQDAMARLVLAYDAATMAARCEEAKAAYLRRYPTGRRAQAVQGACSP